MALVADSGKYWLLKAEPNSRVVKGKEVKVRSLASIHSISIILIIFTQFSVDDFESVKTSPWEGVRNYEARNLMKEMQLGDKASQVLKEENVSELTILPA